MTRINLPLFFHNNALLKLFKRLWLMVFFSHWGLVYLQFIDRIDLLINFWDAKFVTCQWAIRTMKTVVKDDIRRVCKDSVFWRRWFKFRICWLNCFEYYSSFSLEWLRQSIRGPWTPHDIFITKSRSLHWFNVRI